MSNLKEYSIIMVGKAAGSTALSILRSKKESLALRYPKRYLLNACERLEREKAAQDMITESLSGRGLSVHFYTGKEDENGSAILKEKYVDCYVFCCGFSGVFGMLWNLGEYLKTGLKVNLFDIPIDQAAIELCDFEDINPYESDSTGSYLIAAKEPGRVLETLKEAGVRGRLIGYTTGENARIIVGTTERYLTKP